MAKKKTRKKPSKSKIATAKRIRGALKVLGMRASDIDSLFSIPYNSSHK